MAAVADYFLSQFDTSPAIQATLLGTDGKTPVNLTGATVRLSVKPANGAAVLTGGLASIVGDPTLGVVRYQWQPVDVALAGMFNAEWIVTFPGSHEMTWPNDKYLRIEIKPRLDPGDTPPVPSPLVGTITPIVSLDGVNTGAQQLVALSTTNLASGAVAWVESVHDYFVLEKTGTSFTADNVNIVAGLNGGQWLRRGFALPVTVDPSTGGGLALPVGFRVRMADGSAAWDKYGPAATNWRPVGSGTSTLNAVASASPGITIASPTGPTATFAQALVADWTVGLCRVYAVDFANGNDGNAGYADPATNSAGDYAIACNAARIVAKKTTAGLAAIFPRLGAGRNVEVVFGNGGVNTAQAYAGQLGDFLNGTAGYNIWSVRATGTNTTAGCTAFDGSVADATYQGAITVTGLNAAGYNPSGASTTSLPCVLAGGGAASLPAEPAAPLGWRVRFDAGSATVALRNQCRQIAQIVGDTVTPQTAFSATPANGDVFYIEQAGVTVAATTISLGNTGVSASASGTPNSNISGIRVTGAFNVFASGFRMGFCGSTGALQLSGSNQITFSQFIVHPVLGTITMGGGFRADTSITLNGFPGGQHLMSGLVNGNGNLNIFSNTQIQWQTGSYSNGRVILSRNFSGAGIDLSDFPSQIGGLVTFGRPRIVGRLSVMGGSATIGILDITGAGANPAIQLEGLCLLGIGAQLVSGSTGNNDVGLDLSLCYGCTIILGAVQPTVTGAIGDVRLAGGQIVTWAQLMAGGIVDSWGNRIISTRQPPLGVLSFSGAILGGAGTTVSYLSGTGIIGAVNQTTAFRRPTSARLAHRLRVTCISTTAVNAVTCTLYKNGSATAMQVSIPSGTAANTKFVDSGHPIIFADGDDFDLRLDDAADVGAVVNVSAALEYAI